MMLLQSLDMYIVLKIKERNSLHFLCLHVNQKEYNSVVYIYHKNLFVRLQS